LRNNSIWFRGVTSGGVHASTGSCDDAVDLPVSGRKYTFGVLKAAQARGDFDVLVERDRRALRAHLSTDVAAGLSTLRAPSWRHWGLLGIALSTSKIMCMCISMLRVGAPYSARGHLRSMTCRWQFRLSEVYI